MAEKEYKGTLFCEKLKTGRCGVKINLTDTGIESITQDGELFSISYNLIKIENIEPTGKIFKLSGGNESFHFVSHDKSLLRKINRTGTQNVTEQIKTINTSNRNLLTKKFIIAGIVIGFFIILYLMIPVLFNSAISLLPKELDEQLGQVGMLQIQDEFIPFNDTFIQNSIDEILVILKQNLGPDNDWQFKIILVHNEVTNAFALPGGTIFVFTGLLSNSTSAEEVAGVIAHEMGHVINRHGIKRIAQSIGTIIIIQLLFGDSEGFLELAAEFLTVASVNNYSQSQEREADKTSVELMYKAGLNPAAFSEFFYRLKEQGGEVPDYLNWLSTHPSHDERISAIEDMVDDLPETRSDSLDINWEEIQNRLNRYSRFK